MPVAHVITFAQRGRQRSAIQIRVVREFCWRLGAQQRCDGRAFAAEAPQADHRVQAAPAAVELAQMVVCGLVRLRACMVSHACCSLARVACIQTELMLPYVGSGSPTVLWRGRLPGAPGWFRSRRQTPYPHLQEHQSRGRAPPRYHACQVAHAGAPRSRPCAQLGKLPARGVKQLAFRHAGLGQTRHRLQAGEGGRTSAPLAKPSRVRRTSCQSGSRVHSRWDSSCAPDSPSWQRVRLSTKWPTAPGISSLGTARQLHKQYTHAQALEQASEHVI